MTVHVIDPYTRVWSALRAHLRLAVVYPDIEPDFYAWYMACFALPDRLRDDRGGEEVYSLGRLPEIGKLLAVAFRGRPWVVTWRSVLGVVDIAPCPPHYSITPGTILAPDLRPDHRNRSVRLYLA